MDLIRKKLVSRQYPVSMQILIAMAHLITCHLENSSKRKVLKSRASRALRPNYNARLPLENQVDCSARVPLETQVDCSAKVPLEKQVNRLSGLDKRAHVKTPLHLRKVNYQTTLQQLAQGTKLLTKAAVSHPLLYPRFIKNSKSKPPRKAAKVNHRSNPNETMKA